MLSEMLSCVGGPDGAGVARGPAMVERRRWFQERELKYVLSASELNREQERWNLSSTVVRDWKKSD